MPSSSPANFHTPASCATPMPLPTDSTLPSIVCSTKPTRHTGWTPPRSQRPSVGLNSLEPHSSSSANIAQRPAATSAAPDRLCPSSPLMRAVVAMLPWRPVVGWLHASSVGQGRTHVAEQRFEASEREGARAGIAGQRAHGDALFQVQVARAQARCDLHERFALVDPRVHADGVEHLVVTGARARIECATDEIEGGRHVAGGQHACQAGAQCGLGAVDGRGRSARCCRRSSGRRATAPRPAAR